MVGFVGGGLVNMMANAEQWCTSHSKVGEDNAEYEVSEVPPHPHTHTPTYPHTYPEGDHEA